MTETDCWGIAIHSASVELGLAKGQGPREIVARVWNLGRQLSTDFHDRLSEFVHPLSWSQVQFLAVAIGPGGFTSTRIGVVAARTLAQQLDVPLFGFSTLAATAWQQRSHLPDDHCLAVQMPARRGELHGGIYRLTPQGAIATVADRTFTPAEWQDTLDRHPQSCTLVAAEADSGKDAIALLQMAYGAWQGGERPHWSAVLPHYGQHPVDRNSP